MALDLEHFVNQLDEEKRQKLLPALGILVEVGMLSALARVNMNQLVDQRMDSEDEAALAKEVREVRQTNRVLLGLEESAKQLTKGIENA
jgi:hypothetical protein